MTDEMSGETELQDADEWLTALGISDVESGHVRAKAAWQLLIDAGLTGLSAAAEQYTTAHLVFSGLLARAQGLHEGSVAATDAGNPYAAFTLLRGYSENAAAILYVTDHPTQLDNFWRPDGPGVKVGRITNHAVKRFAGFSNAYSELTKYAHPLALSVLASNRVVGDRVVEWSSSPRFHSERDQILAYAWAVELATATADLLIGFARRFQLIIDQPH